MKEIRVYVVDFSKYQGEENVYNMNNIKFMQEAERQGNVYSLKGFENDYNYDFINTTNSVIRFVEVECKESINFEEWNIPVVELDK